MTFEEDSKILFRTLFEETDLNKKEENIIEIIGKYELEGRLYLRKNYESTFKMHNLLNDIEERLSGNFSKLVGNLFSDPYIYDCQEIFSSIGNNRYKFNIVLEVITSRPYWYLQKMKVKFLEIFGIDLEEILLEKFNNEIGNGLICIMRTKRDVNNMPNYERANEKAKKLIYSNPSEWLSNISIFSNIFARSSPEELIMIGRIYYENTKKDLVVTIQKEFGENEAQFLMEVIYNICHPYELFATKLNKSFMGFGTDYNTLNRIFITRNEVDMELIRNIYKEIYKIELNEEIICNTSGAYQTLLLELLSK